MAFSGCSNVSSLDIASISGALTIKEGAFLNCGASDGFVMDLPSNIVSLAEDSFESMKATEYKLQDPQSTSAVSVAAGCVLSKDQKTLYFYPV